MACSHPLQGYRSRSVGSSGKRGITFDRSKGWSDLPVAVPCGQCWRCRLERSRQWAIRCVHEASLYNENCFISLTYSDDFLPPAGTLVKKDFQDFMKRLRKRIFPRKVRFFHCGEYGENYGRPHYHACLFGYDFADKWQYKLSKSGLPLFRSPTLEALWRVGRCDIGTVTFESAAYVARYVMAKRTGTGAKSHYVSLDGATGELRPLVPEYITMSRRPGVGARWYEKFKTDVHSADSVVVRGRSMKPPRYYDGLHELEDPEGFAQVALERARSRRREDETPERLAVLEQVAMARSALMESRNGCA